MAIEFITKPYLQSGRPCIAPDRGSKQYSELKKLITIPCKVIVKPLIEG